MATSEASWTSPGDATSDGDRGECSAHATATKIEPRRAPSVRRCSSVRVGPGVAHRSHKASTRIDDHSGTHKGASAPGHRLYTALTQGVTDTVTLICDTRRSETPSRVGCRYRRERQLHVGSLDANAAGSVSGVPRIGGRPAEHAVGDLIPRPP